MQLVLELKQVSDLEILIPLLKRLKISILNQPELSSEISSQKPPLAKHIGALKSMNAEAFEHYFQQTRTEWERPLGS